MLKLKFDTKVVRASSKPDPTTGSIIPPLHQTATYVLEEVGRDKGFDYVFLSTDKTPKHLQRWSQQANQHDHGWLMLDEKVNVTPNSIQWIVYKNLTDTKESFPL